MVILFVGLAGEALSLLPLVSPALSLGAVGRLLNLIALLGSGIGAAVLFHGLALRARAVGAHVPAGGLGAFIALRVLADLPSLLSAVLPFELSPYFLLREAGTTALPLVVLALFAGSVALLALLALALRAAPAPADEAGAAADASSGLVPMPVAASPGSRDMLVGGIVLAIGLMVTIGTFAVASSGGLDGRYVITTGPIVYGIVRLVRGIARRGA
jgi:hypothetical protein